MSAVCKICHELKQGCCLYPENNEGTQIGLTFNEIFRIMKVTNLTYNDFIEKDTVEPTVTEFLSSSVHPVFSAIFPDNVRLKLKIINGKCIFLSEKGCRLPVNSRPHYCRLYPFWFKQDNESLLILLSDSCLAQQQCQTIAELFKVFQTNKEKLSKIFKKLLRDAENHQSESKDYFRKSIACELIFKPLTAKEKDYVVEMVKTIWEGDDYLPFVYDRWVRDKRGLFIGGWYQDRLVGLSKLSFYENGYAWLEGLRADPDSPVRGIASAFNHFFLDHLKTRNDIKTIEFITYFANYPSIHSAEKYGYQRIAIYSYKMFFLKKKQSYPITKEISIINDTKKIKQILSHSDYLQENRICSGWKAYPLTTRILKDYFIKNNSVIGIVENGTISALILYEIDIEKKETHLNFFEYKQVEDFHNLLHYVFTKSLEAGITLVDTAVPEKYPHLDILKKTGFKSFEQENDYFLFRYKGL